MELCAKHQIRQRQYLLFGIMSLAVTALLALLAIKIVGTLESLALVMLIGSCVWQMINGLSLKTVTGESSGKLWKDLMMMGCYFAAFYLASYATDWLLARVIAYYVLFVLISLLLYRSEIKGIKIVASKYLKRIKED